MRIEPDARGVRTFEFHAMGTLCSVRFRLDDPQAAIRFSLATIDWVSRFEARFSRFRPDSVISRINREAGAGWVEVDSETEHLLDLAADLHQRTNGIMDASLLPLLKVWDWKAVRERLPERVWTSEASARNTPWTWWRELPGNIESPTP